MLPALPILFPDRGGELIFLVRIFGRGGGGGSGLTGDPVDAKLSGCDAANAVEDGGGCAKVVAAMAKFAEEGALSMAGKVPIVDS